MTQPGLPLRRYVRSSIRIERFRLLVLDAPLCEAWIERIKGLGIGPMTSQLLRYVCELDRLPFKVSIALYYTIL